ncbi:MmgE/PrpD family protein [Aliiroseovarius sp.]|uniref:MmgE/PrpD family protein n=1 Tax=Aliiroseovarius sp. TaxID=1872442 RepID=UPI002619FAE9|nr:MmgE/PrpD family protein [Aliiroseovarius sp.]
MDTLDFIHDLQWSDLPAEVQKQAELNLLDLTGIGIAAAPLRASRIACGYVSVQNAGPHPMLFDARTASAPGVAHAAAVTIDALDGHDGFNPAKGHAGACALPAAFAMAHEAGNMDGTAFLTAIVLGYELGCRLALALHGSVPEYHTSGAWGAVAAAGIGARYLGLGREASRHALGIAEYHGPRSQMMRCIDHPTMVKDGSGWGAMSGVSAALLAQAGFTGAPALTVEEVHAPWHDLGQRWLTLEQYYKPWPVCRWAHGPIGGVLELRARHGVSADQVDHIGVETFAQSVRLATAEPRLTDEAQYSTSFPSAVALVRGDVTPADLVEEALDHPEVLRLSRSMVMEEHDRANAAFPDTRLSRTRLVLKDGTVLQGDWMEPKWDASAPPSEKELRSKFRRLAGDLAKPVEAAVSALPTEGLAPLTRLLNQPISRETTRSSSS